MSTYLVVFEIIDGTIKDYERLYSYAINAKFIKEITAKDGSKYTLPKGVYKAKTEMKKEEVLGVAMNVANNLGKLCKIVVAEYEHAAWANLPHA